MKPPLKENVIPVPKELILNNRLPSAGLFPKVDQIAITCYYFERKERQPIYGVNLSLWLISMQYQRHFLSIYRYASFIPFCEAEKIRLNQSKLHRIDRNWTKSIEYQAESIKIGSNQQPGRIERKDKKGKKITDEKNILYREIL